MGKQTRTRTTQSFGKGKVTPMQVAFIVDRYLSDNNFSETRSVFRTEASSLISKSPVQEAPKSLLSLGAMLDEYICLKEQKVMVDQEKARLEQEKFKVQNLLQGLQDVMNAYNANGSAPNSTPMIQSSVSRSLVMAPQLAPLTASSAGPVYTSTNVMPLSMPSNIIKESNNLSAAKAPLTRKRSGSSVAVEAPVATKKYRGKLPFRKKPNTGTCNQSENVTATLATAQPDNAAPTKERESSAAGSSPHIRMPSCQMAQGSSVVKNLFNQPWLSSSPANTSGPKTPPQAVSLNNDKLASPVNVSSAAYCSTSNTSQETPTNCTVITSERVTVSPCKHVAYTMERNHCISTNSPSKASFKRLTKRENVKGRLDFDGSDVTTTLDDRVVEEISTSESEKEGDLFDIDLPNLDAFGADFSFSELLVDLDLGFDGLACPCQPDGAADSVSGSSHDSRDGNNHGTDQVTSEFSSTLTEVISGNDSNIQGPETLTTVKSITKRVILSPAKSHRICLEQEKCVARN